MRHGNSKARLGLPTSHAISRLRNLSASLLQHGRIETTLKNAKVMRPFVEKLITQGKYCAMASRYGEAEALLRQLKASWGNNDFAAMLAVRVWGPYFQERPGGYTRIIRTGYRKGDAAEMALIELVLYEEVLPDWLAGHVKQTINGFLEMAVPGVSTLERWRKISRPLVEVEVNLTKTNPEGFAFELAMQFSDFAATYWPRRSNNEAIPMPITVRLVFPGLDGKLPKVSWALRRVRAGSEEEFRMLNRCDAPIGRFLYTPSIDLYRVNGLVAHEILPKPSVQTYLTVDSPVGEIFHARIQTE